MLLQVPFLFYKTYFKVLKFSKNHHNYLKYERVLKTCLLSNFEYCQIWLTYEGLPMEQHHKIETKKTAVQREGKMEEIKGE